MSLLLLGVGSRGGGGGGAAPPGAHRYWRINISDNNTGVDSIAGLLEMQLHVGSNGFGLDAAVGGTASADSQFDGNHAASGAFNDTFDDAATKIWASTDSAFPHWLKYDLGSGNDEEVLGVSISARNGSGAGSAPGAFDVEYSDDDSIWTLAWAESGQTWAAYEHKHFLAPAAAGYTGSPHGSHRYWRIYYVLNDGAGPAASEIEMRATPSGADQCTGGTAADDSHFGAFVPANAFDDDNSTFFASTGFWISYDFGSAKTVAEITWRNRQDSAANQAPAAFFVQYSDDNAVWTTAWGVIGSTGWSLGETRTFTDPNYI